VTTEHGMLIDGAGTASEGGAVFEATNPATNVG
jgi:hypothetical protein